MEAETLSSDSILGAVRKHSRFLSEWCDSSYSCLFILFPFIIDRFRCLKVCPKINIEKTVFVPEKLKQTLVFISAISPAFVSNQYP